EKEFLVFFRIMVSIVALIEILSLVADLPLLFSSSETILPQELMYLQSGYFKYLHPFYQFLEVQGLTDNFHSTTVFVYITALFLLCFGFFSRLSAVIALILLLIIFRSFAPFNYGYDYFLTMSLFYCFIFPIGKYFSIDSKIFERVNNINFNYRRVIQLHLVIA